MPKANTPAQPKEEVVVEIIKQYGVLSTQHKSGWNLELNLVAWGDHQPKFDLRSWSPDHTKMSKGVTLNDKELQALYNILDSSSLVRKNQVQEASSDGN